VLSTIKRVIFRLHWLLGLSAGSVLIIIGLTGAILCFREEILDALNPGVRVISVPAGTSALQPPALLARIRQQRPEWLVSRLEVTSMTGHSARVQAVKAGSRARPQTFYVSPYTGKLLGEARGAAFLGWIERVHRFLLLPGEVGRPVVGSIVGALVVLILTGLVLRWPAHASRIRQWLAFDRRLRGRPLWWSLHAILATWAIPVWLILSVTGIYWAFDGVRSYVDDLFGVHYVPHAKRPARQRPEQTPSIDTAWKTFSAQVDTWTWLRIDLNSPQLISIFWLGPDATHERQRNSMQLGLDGSLHKRVMFATQPIGRRAMATIYPLHMGTYFGMPGRILWSFMGLLLALAGVSGWWLYLLRRRQAVRVSRERKKVEMDSAAGDSGVPFLVAYASQTGHAESLAWRTAQCLKFAGRNVLVRSLAQLSPPELVGYPEALFIVSTYGDGEAPDVAKGFARALQEAQVGLERMQFAVLALGNRQYASYCAFGHFLHRHLTLRGASPAAEIQCVSDSDPDSEQNWLKSLARYGVSVEGPFPEAEFAAWRDFLLLERICLNPGSLGSEIYDIRLYPEGSNPPEWSAGALVEVLPRHPESRVLAWCQSLQLDPEVVVYVAGKACRLADWLSGCEIPLGLKEGVTPDFCLNFKTLNPRRYSIASLSEDGYIRLLVRRHFNTGVPGVASGWLAEACPLQGRVTLRVIANPGFTVTTDQAPCLFVGAGSGLAGLLGLLHERVRRGLGDNWLVFGERQAAVDNLCVAELEALAGAGLLTLDRVYSRDAGTLRYVQDCLKAQAQRVQNLVAQGGSIYVCGSLAGMGKAVDIQLCSILGDACLEDMARQQRYRRDVY